MDKYQCKTGGTEVLDHHYVDILQTLDEIIQCCDNPDYYYKL